MKSVMKFLLLSTFVLGAFGFTCQSWSDGGGKCDTGDTYDESQDASTYLKDCCRKQKCSEWKADGGSCRNGSDYLTGEDATPISGSSGLSECCSEQTCKQWQDNGGVCGDGEEYDPSSNSTVIKGSGVGECCNNVKTCVAWRLRGTPTNTCDQGTKDSGATSYTQSGQDGCCSVLTCAEWTASSSGCRAGTTALGNDAAVIVGGSGQGECCSAQTCKQWNDTNGDCGDSNFAYDPATADKVIKGASVVGECCDGIKTCKSWKARVVARGQKAVPTYNSECPGGATFEQNIDSDDTYVGKGAENCCQAETCAEWATRDSCNKDTKYRLSTAGKTINGKSGQGECCVQYGEEWFDGTLHHIDIEISDGNWAALGKQTAKVGQGDGTCPATKPFEKTYTYLEATKVTIDGNVFNKVGVRKKGYLGSQTNEKPSLKIKLNEYVKGTKLYQMSRFTLNNQKQDPSLMVTCLTAKVFRDAKVPGFRCGFVKVTVNGKNLGVYTTVDQMGEEFLALEFGNGKGALYEGNARADFTDGGFGMMEKKATQGSDREGKPEIEAAVKALDNASDTLAVAEEYFDLPKLLGYMAIESIVGHWDGYCGNQNNYYVYANPNNKNRLTFMPWGPDESFHDTTTVFSNWEYPPSVMAIGRLCNIVYSDDKWRAKYIEEIKRIVGPGKAFDTTTLVAEMVKWDALIKDSLSDFDKKARRDNGANSEIKYGALVTWTKEWIAKRTTAVLADIADGTNKWGFPELPNGYQQCAMEHDLCDCPATGPEVCGNRVYGAGYKTYTNECHAKALGVTQFDSKVGPCTGQWKKASGTDLAWGGWPDRCSHCGCLNWATPEAVVNGLKIKQEGKVCAGDDTDCICGTSKTPCTAGTICDLTSDAGTCKNTARCWLWAPDGCPAHPETVQKATWTDTTDWPPTGTYSTNAGCLGFTGSLNFYCGADNMQLRWQEASPEEGAAVESATNTTTSDAASIGGSPPTPGGSPSTASCPKWWASSMLLFLGAMLLL